MRADKTEFIVILEHGKRERLTEVAELEAQALCEANDINEQFLKKIEMSLVEYYLGNITKEQMAGMVLFAVKESEDLPIDYK